MNSIGNGSSISTLALLEIEINLRMTFKKYMSMHFLHNYPEAIPIKINKAQLHSNIAIFHFIAKENKNTIG